MLRVDHTNDWFVVPVHNMDAHSICLAVKM